MSGFFSFRLTPYIAGSVIPHTAVIPAEVASCFISLSCVFTATASEAPPCAIFEPSIPGPMSLSIPAVAMLFIPIGMSP